MFFLTLLKDQAKALNVPSRQMRWHPLVIKWCLQIYSRSHSLYADLKLPSGRTLSDYKNFSTSKSEWQTSVLDAMRNNFKEQGFSDVGKLGVCFLMRLTSRKAYYLTLHPGSWLAFLNWRIETLVPEIFKMACYSTSQHLVAIKLDSIGQIVRLCS